MRLEMKFQSALKSFYFTLVFIAGEMKWNFVSGLVVE